MAKKILVTGAAGFIGSTFVRVALEHKYEVLILDALTYAGHYENIEDIVNNESCQFLQGNICEPSIVKRLFDQHHFSGVVHFAAESHVDNSISGPKAFIETNVQGTFNLLENAREYWYKLSEQEKKDFRFLQVSTDEVYGALGDSGKFSELTPYKPNSPYSASKASADHLARAWFHTYGLPTIVTNCSNNYGPRQFPEKLIPLMILRALTDGPLPVYGKGQNVRDWIHVEDHSYGLLLAFEKGQPGETYCFGGNSERKNFDVVMSICKIMDELKPRTDGKSHTVNIKYVEDRLGHDWRYAIDDSRAERELGFKRKYRNFEEGLRQTVKWYLENQSWIAQVSEKSKK